MKKNINEFLQDVNAKLCTPTTTQLLQFGTKARVRGQQMLRDDEGMLSTRANVLGIAETFFSATQGRDELEAKFANFSTGAVGGDVANSPSTGQEAVSEVKTVGAIDVTILSLSTSIIPFIAIDRAVPTPTSTVYYNELVALNSNGGLTEGDVANGNFTPANMKVDLSSEVKGRAVTSGTAQDLGKVVPGSVEVTIVDGDKTWVGKDYACNGQIMFPAAAGVTAATIDYDGGANSFAITATSGTITVSFQKDFGASNEADNGTLVVAPQWVPVTLDTTRDSVIVQDNLVNRMAMSKVQMIATAGAGGTSSADILIARTKNMYIEALNKKVLRAVVDKFTATTQAGVNLDLSDYNLGAWANTKNDQVLQLMTNLEAKYLATTGIQPTALITDSYGVAMLSCIKEMWVANPDAVAGLNGLAGYFNGRAVYRHNYINGRNVSFTKTVSGTATTYRAIPFFAVAKLPDNNSGSAIFAEYLPLTSTGVVSNFNQPQNISNGFFSQTGVKVVAEHLVMMGTIVPPTGELYNYNGSAFRA
jgi:hypothetical protein